MDDRPCFGTMAYWATGCRPCCWGLGIHVSMSWNDLFMTSAGTLCKADSCRETPPTAPALTTKRTGKNGYKGRMHQYSQIVFGPGFQPQGTLFSSAKVCKGYFCVCCCPRRRWGWPRLLPTESNVSKNCRSSCAMVRPTRVNGQGRSSRRFLP